MHSPRPVLGVLARPTTPLGGGSSADQRGSSHEQSTCLISEQHARSAVTIDLHTILPVPGQPLEGPSSHPFSRDKRSLAECEREEAVLGAPKDRAGRGAEASPDGGGNE